MILIELVKVFTLSLVALTGLVLIAGIISEAMKNGLGPGQILTAIPLLLPSLLPYTVPTTTLFATCLVYGRLSADNEILALKAAGIHVVHVVWPAVLLGIVASAATLYLSISIIPYTHFVLRSQMGHDIDDLLYGVLKRDGYLRHPKELYDIHITAVSGRTLHGVVIKRHPVKGGKPDLIICAKEAKLRVDLAERQLYVDMRQCHLVEGAVTGFIEERTLPIEIPADWGGSAPKLRSTDMTWSELASYKQKFQSEIDQLERDVALHQRQIDLNRGETHYTDHVRHLSNEVRVRRNYVDAIESEWHMRPAFALGCLCFALIGCPVGIWFGRTDYLSAFVTCFLPIVTVYYPLLFCLINLARAGKASPWLTVHDANAILMVAGAVMFRQLARN